MNIHEWAVKHGVSAAAIHDLKYVYGLTALDIPTHVEGKSESAVSSMVRLKADSLGMRLWRNNVGVLKDERGIPVRYGLANDSKKLNERLKSSDLIGWRRILIEPIHVGQYVAQFTSVEVKHEEWKYTATPREEAQLRWLKLVDTEGGYGRFVNNDKDLT
jgi:hypothetical protein